MIQNAVETHPSESTSRTNHILAAGLLGFVLLLFIGFAPVNAIHNAAHDSRHSVTLPCH
jgi:cobalt transporter subunit CbtB